MILYHGSYTAVEKPDIAFSRINLDFGRGFYTTPIKEQAVSWANRFKRKHGSSVVSSYETDYTALKNNITLLEFGSCTEEWLDFVISCRRGEDISRYDVITGGVANDKVFDTIQLFFDGLIDKEQSIKRLRYDNPNMQYCFRSQPVIDRYLKYISCEVL
jgi:hypothetical protein